MTKTVAVLGTGRMGGPIAVNLARKGFAVRAWNRTREKAEELVASAGLDASALTAAATPADAVRDADVLLTMLADGPATADVVGGAGAGAGTVWIQMGTVGLAWTNRLARLAADAGLAFVDAPVSGSDAPAREGKLLVLASGPEQVRARVQPVFDAIGNLTRWLGPAGAGSAAKLALNNWLAVQVEGVAETLALAAGLGVDTRELLDIIAGSPLGSPFAVTKARAMLDGALDPGFPLKHAAKDADLVRQAASEVGVPVPLTEALLPAWYEAIERGLGDLDVAAAGTRFRLGPAPGASATPAAGA